MPVKTEQPIRIGLDARELARPDTGIGNYVFNLVQALAAVDDKNQYFLFINAGGEDYLHKLALPANFCPVQVPVFPIDKLQDQFGLVRALRRFRLRVFHVTHHDVTPLLAKVPLIVTVHDIAPMDCPNPSWLHRLYYRLFSRLALSRAHHLLCVSTSTGQRVEQRFPFCRGKWSTVYEGRDPYFQVCDDPQGFLGLSDRLGIRPPFMLYVGSFARRKNLTNMIHAFSMVKRSRPEVQFVIVGGPSGRDDVIPTELPAGVVMTGQVSKRELRALYNRAELLLFTTLYEGFGVPVIEAMACGCPVVTSPVTSLPELGGEAVLYAAPNRPDEIAYQALRILNDKGLRQVMIARGLKRGLQFSWEDMACRVLQAYQQCASDGK